MDTIKILKEKNRALSESEHFEAIDIILNHIIRAAKYFNNGCNTGDAQYFNDVIYRTNQAFEGILKEAYQILSGNSSKNMNSAKIEEYFEKNKVLKERVNKLFTNYRQDWRNPSIHEYTLIFTEEEALLALNSVVSFIYVLLSQIIEKVSYDKELLSLNTKSFKGSLTIINDKPLLETVSDALFKFSENTKKELAKKTYENINYFKNEHAILGRLKAYLETLDSEIRVLTEYKVDSKYYVDLLVERNDEKLIIELKRDSGHLSREISINQLVEYLSLTNIKNGILYVFDSKRGVSNKETFNKRDQVINLIETKL